MEEIKEKKMTLILLIINMIIWGIISIIALIFGNIAKAESFQTNNYQLLIQDASNTLRDFGIKQSVYTWAGSYTAKMVEWSPWDTTNNKGYSLIATNYSISFDFSLYQYANAIPNNLPGLNTFQILVIVQSPYQSVVATCDGTETFYSDSDGITNMNNIDVKYYHYVYSCNSLNVNRTFDRVYFVVRNTNGYNPFVALAVSNMYFIDTNDTSSESQEIINNANQNANRIIQNANENTNRIISAYENEMNAIYTPQAPNGNDFNALQQSENQLHTYTNVDLDSVGVNIDSDSASWVWNTLTSILNSHTLIITMVISILSIGIMKLILNR